MIRRRNSWRWIRGPALAILTALSLGAATETPTELRRRSDQTFLTFPEWYLVYSPAEYADYVHSHPPTGFPFFSHIGQFWSSYGSIRREIRREKLPSNFGYNVMIWVIGGSTTVEYSVRGAYESTVGRATAATLHGDLSDEDRYGAVVAQEYVDFIRVYPWYEFNFAQRLARLWTRHSLFGPHFPRKIERRFALSTEYGVKTIYGLIIKGATHLAYGVEPLTTAVVLSRDADRGSPALGQYRVLQRWPSGEVLAQVPRYQAFTGYAQEISREGIDFVAIAGNQGDILVSLIGPQGAALPGAARFLFSQPILTHPGTSRMVVVVPVPELSRWLRSLNAAVHVEHLYDY